jgi:hypothetical protein
LKTILALSNQEDQKERKKERIRCKFPFLGK